MTGFWIMIAIVIGASAILVNGFQANDLNSHGNELDAIKACIYANGYDGVSWEDNRQLFIQCLDDYKDSR